MRNEILKRYQFIQKIILDAGNEALQFYQNRNNLNISFKQNDSQNLVSLADKTVEKIIKSTILSMFPHDGFLGEEYGSENTEQTFCWVVDPIDGTSSFLQGLHGWCISIALIYQQENVLGVIYDPVHQELFHAMKGEGAFVNTTPIQATQAHSFNTGLVGLGCTHHIATEKYASLIKQLLDKKGVFYRNGSAALMLAYVASGRLLAHFEPYIYAWDCLAGEVLITEAGGITSSFLAQHNNWLAPGYVIAAGKEIFDDFYTICCSL